MVPRLNSMPYWYLLVMIWLSRLAVAMPLGMGLAGNVAI